MNIKNTLYAISVLILLPSMLHGMHCNIKSLILTRKIQHSKALPLCNKSEKSTDNLEQQIQARNALYASGDITPIYCAKKEAFLAIKHNICEHQDCRLFPKKNENSFDSTEHITAQEHREKIEEDPTHVCVIIEKFVDFEYTDIDTRGLTDVIKEIKSTPNFIPDYGDHKE